MFNEKVHDQKNQDLDVEKVLSNYSIPKNIMNYNYTIILKVTNMEKIDWF